MFKNPGLYFDITITVSEEAEAQFTQIGNLSETVMCLHSLGNILKRQAIYIEAVKKFEEAENIFSTIGFKDDTAQCHNAAA